jgi:hypothetical protein
MGLGLCKNATRILHASLSAGQMIFPTPADYDGDGRAELAVYRPSNGTWYFYNLATNQTSGIAFGTGEDKPVPADYDGDGKN